MKIARDYRKLGLQISLPFIFIFVYNSSHNSSQIPCIPHPSLYGALFRSSKCIDLVMKRLAMQQKRASDIFPHVDGRADCHVVSPDRFEKQVSECFILSMFLP